jgi:hypothetical protein
MAFWIYFFESLEWWLWIAILMALCGFYFLIVDPFIYHCWIIPIIEKRYKEKLIFDMPGYGIVLLPGWFMPPSQIGVYIVFKYLGWRIALINNPYAALKRINYDIKTASKAEIVMSFITVINFLLIIIAAIVFSFNAK